MATPKQTVSFDVFEEDMLEVSVPGGDVSIKGEDVQTGTATLAIKCPRKSSRCATWTDEIELLAERRGTRINVGVTRPAKVNASVKVLVTVPKSNSISVSMGYGDLQIRGVENCVSVDMTAGDLFIEMPIDAVRAVHVSTLFGDAILQVGSASQSGRRPLLVGAKLDWREGVGSCHVNASLRFGDARVKLSPSP